MITEERSVKKELQVVIIQQISCHYDSKCLDSSEAKGKMTIFVICFHTSQMTVKPIGLPICYRIFR